MPGEELPETDEVGQDGVGQMSYVKPGMKDALKNHVLEEVLPQTGEFRAFYLKEPGQGRVMSTLFVFTPEGIVIMGDLCPGGPKNQGSISDYNYGLAWFSSKLSERYLCSKFMTPVWQIEVAEGWVREHIEEIKKEADADDLKRLPEWEDLFGSLEGGEMGADHFHETLHALDYEPEDEGCDYHWNTAGWLCALQQRFSELISAKAGAPLEETQQR
jgi:hypothetical protein